MIAFESSKMSISFESFYNIKELKWHERLVEQKWKWKLKISMHWIQTKTKFKFLGEIALKIFEHLHLHFLQSICHITSDYEEA